MARWDVLVVDEGQRLKSGPKGLLFDALQSLNINLRVLLSGTPLNNNLTELFNLLHFINPSKYGNTKELEERYEVLNEEKVCLPRFFTHQAETNRDPLLFQRSLKFTSILSHTSCVGRRKVLSICLP